MTIASLIIIELRFNFRKASCGVPRSSGVAFEERRGGVFGRWEKL